ncbi:MAG: glutamine-hydrolyzing carbamoyl-phosphate synthase small subunit [Bacillales bacterium]|nr:glutamine-hydrolyzing carbamoyl-phosphate synthase small subunit [Bacillales bacterium]
MKRKLVLENGKVFVGDSFGATTTKVAELVFNTSVVGYQEILSDPSNCQKMVCMSYPVIGNYGLNDEDYESNSITVSGIICRQYNPNPSNFRYTHELSELMEENDVPGIQGIDTREITRIIKNEGRMKALICDEETSMEECMRLISSYNTPKNIVELVSTKKIWHSRTASYKYVVACIDCGIKKSLVKMLNHIGCNVVVLPYDSSLEVVMKYKPNGIFISDGPCNPLDLPQVVDLIKQLKGKLPCLGVGIGQELIGLAYGTKVYKQKVGHNGSNLPVRNLKNNKIEITSQNDIFALEEESLKNTSLTITHKNLLDNVIEGIEDLDNGVIACQYNPSENMEDEEYIFNRFVKLMNQFGGKKNA